METKLIAAEISTAAGVTTIITSSKHPENVFRIIEYDLQRKSGSSSPPLVRPPHTVFTASSQPMRDLKSWTSHTLNPSGSVIIDAGAYHVLSKRESGGRLLAAGVVGVVGAFASGQAVRIVVRRRRVGHEEKEEERKAYLKALETTRPSTPTSAAAFSSEEVVAEEQGDEKTEGEKDGLLGEADVLEVGRGLANYNSAQILAVKGMKRCVLSLVAQIRSCSAIQLNVTAGVGIR
jgi:glutamate 5-kinase